ncbi:MAG: signal peptidase II [Anaerolineales bacterium]|nr:signal peptidase II [Anaerolineales bacterium]
MNEELVKQEKTQPRGMRFLTFFLVAACIVGLDQWTKWLVRRDIPMNTSWLPDSLEWLSPYARVFHIQNRGASFGMFQNGNIFFIVLSLAVVTGIVYYVSHMEHSSMWMWVAAGLYLGGAVGNLIDRVTIGAVTDFVSVGTFYIFNVADASINVSVALLLILFWLHEREPSKPLEATDAEENS